MGRGGWPKKMGSSGRYCLNPRCAYFAIPDAAIHALVADGHHGQDGSIQNWQCQACGQHASDRFGTFLYRLKKPEVMAQTLTSVSQGQEIRATALSQGVNKDTVLAWWMRLGSLVALAARKRPGNVFWMSCTNQRGRLIIPHTSCY
jgi:hypothetical protein